LLNPNFFYIYKIWKQVLKNLYKFLLIEKLIQTMTKSMPLNQEQIIKVELTNDTQSIPFRFNSRFDDIDMKNDIDLSKGNRLQFAMIDDQLKVSQRSDRSFPQLPYQFKKKRRNCRNCFKYIKYK